MFVEEGIEGELVSQGVTVIVTPPKPKYLKHLFNLTINTNDAPAGHWVGIYKRKGSSIYLVARVTVTAASSYALPRERSIVLDADDESIEVEVEDSLGAYFMHYVGALANMR